MVFLTHTAWRFLEGCLSQFFRLVCSLNDTLIFLRGGFFLGADLRAASPCLEFSKAALSLARPDRVLAESD